MSDLSANSLNPKRKHPPSEPSSSGDEHDDRNCDVDKETTPIVLPQEESPSLQQQQKKKQKLAEEDSAADDREGKMSDFADDEDMDVDDDYDEDEEEEDSDSDLVLEDVPSGKELNQEEPCQVLSPVQIVQHMTECIQSANAIIQLPETTMRALLNHVGWDKEKLMSALYDEDPEKLYQEAHVVDPTVPVPLPPAEAAPSSSSASGEGEVCDICGDDKMSSEMLELQCQHRFCISCWKFYLTTKIVAEGIGDRITCAAFNCPILVDDETVIKLVNEADVIQKYLQLITNNFVKCHRLMRWCPSAGCSNAVLVAQPDHGPVKCTCSHSFCFQCGHNDHNPITCAWLKKWLKKCAEDAANTSWLAKNTKECPNPKCNATIEKNGGCNHMHCKECNFHFCWICLGPWNIHGTAYYNCNKYNASESENARDAQEKLRASMNRYLFYYSRYASHMQSLKFENKLYDLVRGKMQEMQKYHGMTWIEVQFLTTAVDVLRQCRQTLMYTYAFAFYLQKNNQSIIFEDNQRDLENATEILSEYLERDITTANLNDIQPRVKDKFSYCEKRRNALVNHVNEGYRNSSWLYKE